MSEGHVLIVDDDLALLQALPPRPSGSEWPG